MKKGDELTVKVTKLTKLNQAEAIALPEETDHACNNSVSENRKICIKNAVPGQKARVRITKKRKGKVEARILEVLENQENVCENGSICGGCTYLSVRGEEELAIKDGYLKELFQGYPYEGITESPRDKAYRNKMEYSFGDAEKDGPLTLGLHQRGSFYNVLNTDGCILAPADFEIIRKNILEYFREKGETYFHKRSHQGLLRHLVLRKGFNTGEILVNLVTSSQGELDKEEFVQMLTGLEGLDGEITGIIHTVNDSVADAVIADETHLLYGEPNIHETLLGLEFEITPFSFFQVNTSGAELLYEIVRDYAREALKDKENSVIYDLYSGTGTITMILSELASKVIGIELVEEATQIAQENAEHNGIENCVFLAGDVLERAKELEERPDLIVLDPPREGIRPKAMKRILDLDPEHFIYVSCNPESLKRNLPLFIEKGYKVLRMRSVNMFPLTAHAETVALLSK